MEISDKLWDLTLRICKFSVYNGLNHSKLENTNKEFERLGMSSRATISPGIYMDHFNCVWDMKDISLFDIRFFHLLLNILAKGDYVFNPISRGLIIEVNEYFEKNNIPYMTKFTNNEIKLYLLIEETLLKL